jgi:hypothetical protein
MSEEDKNKIIKSVYKAPDGFGSVATTFTKAKQQDNTITKQNYLSKGYVDVTDGFKKKTNPLQIPDGTYKCDGMGYSFNIVTNDGKDTGYVVTMMFGVRGMITGPLTVSDNGTNVSVDFGDFNRVAESILYNEKLNQVKV